MKMKLALLMALCSAGTLLFAGEKSSSSSRTIRGWFADEACTRDRVAAGKIEPNNPDCAKRCLKEGSKLVFISETDKTMFYVSNPVNATSAVGYYVEVAGVTDDKAKTVRVDSVKKLSEVGDMCARPPVKRK